MTAVTPLHGLHLEAHAKMTLFSGWEMPLHYGSQLDEHHRVRNDSGVFDVSHMLMVDVSGSGATAFLRLLLANDVARLGQPGRALYSCMLDEQGGVIDDVIVLRMAEDVYRIVFNAGCAVKDAAWVERMRTRLADAPLEIRPRRDSALLAVQGPRARVRSGNAFPALQTAIDRLGPFECVAVGGWFLSRTGYTGEDGLEIALPAVEAAAAWDRLIAVGVAPIGLGARDTLRLEAGLALYGQDMDESVTPFECGLGWTVDSRSARDFVGRSALGGRKPRYVRVGLLALQPGILRAHQTVESGFGPGLVTSGGFAPTLGRSIALARMPAGATTGGDALVRIRDRDVAVRMVDPPFVRNGRVLVEGVHG